MGGAEEAERVDDGVHDRGESPDIAGLAGAVDTQRVGLGRHRVLVHLERADFVGARRAVIHQRAGEGLARVPVIDEVLGEGLADAPAAASSACAAIFFAFAMILTAAMVAALPPSTAVREA